ncbi:unnamed protein product [Closterium sp. Naga37s-1]|nr:unnamed protein product [Closterium sp. Naga37s-1]
MPAYSAYLLPSPAVLPSPAGARWVGRTASCARRRRGFYSPVEKGVRQVPDCIKLQADGDEDAAPMLPSPFLILCTLHPLHIPPVTSVSGAAPCPAATPLAPITATLIPPITDCVPVLPHPAPPCQPSYCTHPISPATRFTHAACRRVHSFLQHPPPFHSSRHTTLLLFAARPSCCPTITLHPLDSNAHHCPSPDAHAAPTGCHKARRWLTPFCANHYPTALTPPCSFPLSRPLSVLMLCGGMCVITSKLQPRGATDFRIAQHRSAPSLFSHQILMLHCGLPARITDCSHEAAQRGREAGRRRKKLPALITDYSHEAAQRARGSAPLASCQRQTLMLHPCAPSLCSPPGLQITVLPHPSCHQVLMLRQKLPALITDYSHEAAQRALEVLCSLVVDVERCPGGEAARGGGESCGSCAATCHQRGRRGSKETTVRPGRLSARCLLRCKGVARGGAAAAAVLHCSLSSAR